MRVSQLNEIVTIDTSIQNLLSDLQDLYVKRQSIVEADKPSKASVEITTPVSIDEMDLDHFDLSLTSSLLPRRSLYS